MKNKIYIDDQVNIRLLPDGVNIILQHNVDKEPKKNKYVEALFLAICCVIFILGMMTLVALMFNFVKEIMVSFLNTSIANKNFFVSFWFSVFYLSAINKLQVK